MKKEKLYLRFERRRDGNFLFKKKKVLVIGKDWFGMLKYIMFYLLPVT